MKNKNTLALMLIAFLVVASTVGLLNVNTVRANNNNVTNGGNNHNNVANNHGAKNISSNKKYNGKNIIHHSGSHKKSQGVK